MRLEFQRVFESGPSARTLAPAGAVVVTVIVGAAALRQPAGARTHGRTPPVEVGSR